MKYALLLVAACSSSSEPVPAIESVTPAFGPLSGGTRVVIGGKDFALEGTTRVFVAGREAPLASAIDDQSIEVVIPPGDRPGDAEVIVIDNGGNAVETGVFRYSTQPAIDRLEPAELLFTTPATLMTLTGSGFVDEGAGEAMVLVDGVPAMDLVIVDDTKLTFTAPAGKALVRPRIDIVNARGLASKERGFRYRPSMKSGILLFPRSGPFAIFFSPDDSSRVDIARTQSVFIQTTIVDEEGEYWASDGSRVGRFDVGTQRLEQTAPTQFRIPAMARVGDDLYGIDRWNSRFGKIGLDGTFTPIGDVIPCCGSFGLAYNGNTLYFAYRNGIDKLITPIDPATGVLGTPVKLVGGPNLHVEEMRFFGGQLYAASRDSTLVRIDPATGMTTVIASIPRTNAMEVFE